MNDDIDEQRQVATLRYMRDETRLDGYELGEDEPVPEKSCYETRATSARDPREEEHEKKEQVEQQRERRWRRDERRLSHSSVEFL